MATPQLPNASAHPPNAYNPPDEIKDPQQSVDTQGQKQGQKNSSSKPNPIQEIDDELKRYIIDDLAKKEQEGVIKNMNAVFRSLTQEDIEIYRQKYEEFLKEKHMKEMKEKYKVCRIEMDIVKDEQKAISLFGDIFKTTDHEAIKNEIKRRKYKVVKNKIGKQYIFVLFEKAIAEYIYDRTIDMMLKVDIYEYTEEYESFFN